MPEGHGGGGRPKLSRAEQRYNYGIAIVAVLVVVVLIVVSPEVSMGGQRIPVLVLAVLVGAFLFGLGQMIVGIVRRRTYLRGLKPGDGGITPQTTSTGTRS